MVFNAICGDLFGHRVAVLAADSKKKHHSLCNQLTNSILSSYFIFSFLLTLLSDLKKKKQNKELPFKAKCTNKKA